MEASSASARSEAEQRLLDWCGDHGLLGLLPHQTVRTSLAPRRDNLGASDTCVPRRDVHRRDAYGWSATFAVLAQPLDARPPNARVGDLVNSSLYQDFWPEPTARMHMLRGGRWTTQLPFRSAGTLLPE